LLFGPEDWGLSSEDIQYSNFCCSIPTYGENSSLNLAQATLLAMHIYRSVFGGEKTRLDGQQKLKALQKKPTDVFPDESLKAWLLEMGFKLDQKKMNVFTVLRRMLLQNAPSVKEFRILEIVLQQSRRKLKELNDLKTSK
jgi:tRNA/rRNA methyltransferase